MAVSVLIGGRTVEIAFDEWPFYREHLRLIPAPPHRQIVTP